MIKELTQTEESKDVTSDKVLLWTRQVKAQRTKTAVLNNLKVNKALMPYDQISRKDKIMDHKIATQAHENTVDPATHLKRCLAYRKRCEV